jgi:hypothetical protein
MRKHVGPNPTSSLAAERFKTAAVHLLHEGGRRRRSHDAATVSDMENYETLPQRNDPARLSRARRTALASEPHALPYVRTFAGLFASGMGVLKLFDSPLASIAGSVLIVVSPVFLVIGFSRFFQIQKLLKPLTAPAPNGRAEQEHYVQAEATSENPRGTNAAPNIDPPEIHLEKQLFSCQKACGVFAPQAFCSIIVEGGKILFKLNIIRVCASGTPVFIQQFNTEKPFAVLT